MAGSNNSKKPIVHGFVDPTDIPFYCKKCAHYQNPKGSFPYCDRREDGKFRPEVAFSCYVNVSDSSKKEKNNNGNNI